jgi:hypothetical protein
MQNIFNERHAIIGQEDALRSTSSHPQPGKCCLEAAAKAPIRDTMAPPQATWPDWLATARQTEPDRRFAVCGNPKRSKSCINCRMLSKCRAATGLLASVGLPAASAINVDFIHGGVIASNITINVPADYPTIPAAFAALADKRVADSVVATIQIADGTHTLASALTPPRAIGANLQIMEIPDPGNAVLSFPNVTHGFALTGGQTLNLINGLTHDGVTANASANTAGVYVAGSSSVTVGPAVVCKRFTFGVQASLGSTINCNSIAVMNNIIGVASNTGSTVLASGVTATNNSYNGFYANNAGIIYAYSATSTDTTYQGFLAQTNGIVLGP